jgi:hypothetical protein
MRRRHAGSEVVFEIRRHFGVLPQSKRAPSYR